MGLLAKNFQLHSFKPWQTLAIDTILKGKDVLVIQPTGSGKSLCYQFPSLVTHKITLVLTPTISLMADQTTSLLAKGLRATFLGTAQKDPSAEHSVKNGEVDIVYLTPERLFTETGTIQHPFLDLIKQILLLRCAFHNGTRQRMSSRCLKC